MTDAPEPISPDHARDLLEAAIRERLGEGWENEDSGWTRVTGHDYMARVSRGRVNLDFYVDLLGHVTVEQTESSATADTGRLLLWIMLGLSIVIALLIVRIASGG
jgi:hypothetical protein